MPAEAKTGTHWKKLYPSPARHERTQSLSWSIIFRFFFLELLILLFYIFDWEGFIGCGLVLYNGDLVISTLFSHWIMRLSFWTCGLDYHASLTLLIHQQPQQFLEQNTKPATMSFPSTIMAWLIISKRSIYIFCSRGAFTLGSAHSLCVFSLLHGKCGARGPSLLL